MKKVFIRACQNTACFSLRMNDRQMKPRNHTKKHRPLGRRGFIIILNHNNKEVILDCLKSVSQLSVVSYQLSVIVVDNASSDVSVELVRKKFPNVKIIKNKKNLGFAGGNNKGVKYALRNKADYIMLLNPDTIVPKKLLSKLIQSIELDKKVGIIGPVIKFKREGKWVYDFGGKINWWLGRAYHLESYQLSVISYQSLDYVSGCCMLVRKGVFEKIGLLDESTFIYYEDADFCVRATRVGYKILINPEAIIYHQLKEIKEKPSWFRIYHNLRGNLFFINKHITWYRKPIAFLYWGALGVKMMISLIGQIRKN